MRRVRVQIVINYKDSKGEAAGHVRLHIKIPEVFEDIIAKEDGHTGEQLTVRTDESCIHR